MGSNFLALPETSKFLALPETSKPKRTIFPFLALQARIEAVVLPLKREGGP
jgi:hypothetical protein